MRKLKQISKGQIRIFLRPFLKFIKRTKERRWIDFCVDFNFMVLPEFDSESYAELSEVLAFFINPTGITEIHGCCGLRSDRDGIEPKDFKMIFFVLVLEDGKLKDTIIQYGNGQKQSINENGEIKT